MDIKETALEGVKIITPHRFGDARGYFCESWNAARLAEAGIEHAFVQDNESLSATLGTLRGLHYQAPPFAQTKLVRVAMGAVLDVAVDARRGSPNYGKWVSAELSAKNGAQLLVPAGFLHGFITLVPNTLVLYKVDNPYNGPSDGGVAWDDPTLGIDWGATGAGVVLSDKDGKQPAFDQWKSPFEYGDAS